MRRSLLEVVSPGSRGPRNRSASADVRNHETWHHLHAFSRMTSSASTTADQMRESKIQASEPA